MGNALLGAEQTELAAVKELPNLRLFDNVDATRLAQGSLTGRDMYDRIIFNNPHIEEGGPIERARATADLIAGFVQSARTRLTPTGFVRININPRFVGTYPTIGVTFSDLGGRYMGRFADDPNGLFVAFHPLRTNGEPLRQPAGIRPGSGLDCYNFQPLADGLPAH